MKDIRTATTIFDTMTAEEFAPLGGQIIESNNIDYRHIRDSVFSQLGLTKKKRFSRKRLLIGLLAAVIGFSAIGLGIGAAATGSFQKVFGGFIDGDSSDGFSNGSGVTAQSDKVTVDFSGITGSNFAACASFTLKNKDGSHFVEDYENVRLYYEGNRYETKPAQESPNHTVWATDNHTTDNEALDGVFGYLTYQMEDNATIRVYAVGYTNGYSVSDIKGKVLHIRDKQINAYRTVDVLYQPARCNQDNREICSDVIAELSQKYPEMWQFFVNWEGRMERRRGLITDEWIQEMQQHAAFIQLVREAYAPLLEENQVVLMDGLRDGLLLCEKTPLTLDYTIEVNLDYPVTTRKFDIDPSKVLIYTPHPEETVRSYDEREAENFKHEPVAFTLDYLEADALSVRFKVRSKMDEQRESLFDTSMYDTVTVEMKDGTRYQTEYSPDFETEMLENNRIATSHSYMFRSDDLTDEGTYRLMSIDPNEIAAVYLGDTRLY